MNGFDFLSPEAKVIHGSKDCNYDCHDNCFYHAACYFLDKKESNKKSYDAKYVISEVFHKRTLIE